MSSPFHIDICCFTAVDTTMLLILHVCSIIEQLTIDWNFMASFKIPIDEFEMKRSGNRRKYTHLRLLPISRVQILQRSTDATPEEIEKATVEAYLFSYQRMRTLQNLLFHDMLKRSVKRLFRFGKKSSAETTRSLIVKASV